MARIGDRVKMTDYAVQQFPSRRHGLYGTVVGLCRGGETLKVRFDNCANKNPSSMHRDFFEIWSPPTLPREDEG